MMFTSKCFQCCNSGFNCNANWQPSSEADWSWNDIRGHRYNEAKDDDTSVGFKMRPSLTTANIIDNDTSQAFYEFLKSQETGFDATNDK